jgi:hypothetical protein
MTCRRHWPSLAEVLRQAGLASNGRLPEAGNHTDTEAPDGPADTENDREREGASPTAEASAAPPKHGLDGGNGRDSEAEATQEPNMKPPHQQTKSVGQMTPREAAGLYISKGMYPVPVSYREKAPKQKGWPDLRLKADGLPKYFSGASANIGIILGEPCGLLDVDNDCPEAIAAAPNLLPETGMIFGRKSARQSHYFYYCDPPAPTRKYVDPIRHEQNKGLPQDEKKKTTIVEIRCQDDGAGIQTIVPPSVHPNGERIEFEPGYDKEPANVDAAVVQKAVASIAAAAMLARYWPGEGTRNDAFIALAGALARAEYPVEDAVALNCAIDCLIWGHRADLRTAKGEVESTYKKYAAGKNVTGRPTLSQLMDKRAVDAAFNWLGLGAERHNAEDTNGAAAGAHGACVGPLAGGSAGSLITRRVADITPKSISWLWPERIPRGKVTVTAGDPGLGKSQTLASVAAIVTTGGQWPVTRERCVAGDALFLTAEDDVADTLRPRLEAAGANLERVHVIDGVIAGYAADGTQQDRMFSLEKDLRALEQKLVELRDVAVVVIDPISSYLGSADSHRNSEIRGLLAPLVQIAARHNVAIIAITHLNKAPGAKALMRVLESVAFVALARAVFLVTPDPGDRTRRLFLPAKSNIARDTGGLAFRIEGAVVNGPEGQIQTSRVMWESEPVTMTDEAMQPPEPPKDGSKLDEASEWLHLTLVDGPVPAAKIFAMAQVARIAEKTLQRAAKILNVNKEKSGKEGSWAWSLPPLKPTQDGQGGQEFLSRDFGHLAPAGSLPDKNNQDGQGPGHGNVDHLDHLDHLDPSSGADEGGFAEEEI